MTTELREVIETMKQDCNLLDTKNEAKRGAMLVDAFPEIIVNLISRFAQITCRERSSAFTELQKIYNKHTDLCLQYVAEYLTYPIHGIDDEHTKLAVEQTQIGVVLYTFWCKFYQDWDRQRNTGKSKLASAADDEMVQEIESVLYEVLGKSETVLKEKAKKGEEHIVYRAVAAAFRGQRKVRIRDIIRIAVASLLIAAKETPTEFQKDTEWLKAFRANLVAVLILYDMDTLVGEKGRKDPLWMEDTKKCFSEVYQYKSLDDIPEECMLQDDGKAKVLYGDMLDTTLEMFGLQYRAENLSKRERTEILSVLGACTFLNGENSLSKRAQGKVLAYEMSIYHLSKKVSMQAKEKILFMIRTEARERKASEFLDKSEELTKKIESLQEELLKEREDKENLQKRLTKAEQQSKEYYDALIAARNKLDTKNARLDELVSSLQNLYKTVYGKEMNLSDIRSDLGDRKNDELKNELANETECGESSGNVVEIIETSEENTYPSTEEMLEYIEDYCSKHKVICFGGNQNLKKKAQYRYPGLRFMDNARSTDFDPAIWKADLIIFKTDSMSHRMFNKAKDTAIQFGTPYKYLESSTNFERLDKSLYNIIRNQQENN